MRKLFGDGHCPRIEPRRGIGLIAGVLGLIMGTAQADPFAAGNVVIYRVGTGSSALSGTATEVFLDEYTTSGALVQSLALPTADASANQTLTASGTATSEGLISLSKDGRFILLTGYDAPVGTAMVSASNTNSILRVIGRAASNGTIDTSTTTTSFSGTNIRSAASSDGTNLYATGGNSGVVLQALGSSGLGTSISTTFNNLRQINIFNGQLYVSSTSGSGLATVGSGVPTTTGQTTTPVTGILTTLNLNQFVLLDRDTGIPGPDTLYIADESALIRKYSSADGTNFTEKGSVALTSVRGLTGAVSGNNAVLYATNGSTLVSLTDSAAFNAPMTQSAPTVLATAPTNTAFRGIAFAPAAPTITGFTPTSGAPGTSVTITGTNFTGATSVSFNYVSATFTVNSATQITATVPSNAGTGKIRVTTPVATATSAANFTPILPVATTGAIISEFRTRGINGATDDYIELYNTSSTPINIGGWRLDYVGIVDRNPPPGIQINPIQTDLSDPGFTLPGSTSSGSFVSKSSTFAARRPAMIATPSLDFITATEDQSTTIPANTVIPPRGHYLLTGSGYSLTATASSNQSLANDILDNSSLVLRNAGGVTQDAVAFSGSGSTVAGEGTALPAPPNTAGEYAFVRDESTGAPQDTNNNAADFLFVSTNAGLYNGRQSQLGAPGPANLSSPALTPALTVSGIDPKADINYSPNRIRVAATTPAATNATFGTLIFRRNLKNNTGKTITRLRFRFSRLTTLNSPTLNPSSTQADLRFLSSSSGTVPSRDGSSTLSYGGTTLETPPTQDLGGGVNSSASGFTTVTLPAGLAPGASANYQFVFGVEKNGGFTAIFNIEALND